LAFGFALGARHRVSEVPQGVEAALEAKRLCKN
jgi:hypothetical protein